jgi:hypothetical protein
LAVAVDGDGEVDLGGEAAPEVGAELGVERRGDGFRHRPGEHADVEVGCGGDRGAGGVFVVGVAGDAPVVEHHEHVGWLTLGGREHVGGANGDGVSA